MVDNGLMRDQGRLIEWFDEKGYGFIQPTDPDKARIFLHIKDFARPGPRPLLGCALEYNVTLDAQGRFRAQQVKYLKASQAKTQLPRRPVPQSTPAQAIQPLQIASIIYMIALAILTLIGWLAGFVLLLVSIVNIITYWVYMQDKQAAQNNQRRVPERNLHILAMLGGWPAANVAQQKLRHKTQKQPFRKIYFCSIALNIILMLCLISPLNPF